MKILFLSGSNISGNTPTPPTFLHERYKEYKKKGLKFHIYCIVEDETFFLKFFRKLKSRQNNIFNRIFSFEGIEYDIILHKQGILSRFFKKKEYGKGIANAIEKTINLSEYDLIVCHFAYPAALGAYELYIQHKIPYVVFAHGSDIHTIPEQCPIYKEQINQSLEHAAANVFVSNKLKQLAIKNGFSGNHSYVITNGVNLSLFTPIDKESCREYFQIDKKHPCVGFVGNLIPIKRADSLVQIFSIIKDKFQNISFIVVGDGYLKLELENQAEQKKLNITFTGHIPYSEIPKAMNAMDLMILPSRNEGFGCVILEAYACGTPVVGSNNGGIPEAVGDPDLIIKNGPEFEKRMSDKVIEKLKCPPDRDKLISRSKKYSWDETVKKEIEVFQDCVSLK